MPNPNRFEPGLNRNRFGSASSKIFAQNLINEVQSEKLFLPYRIYVLNGTFFIDVLIVNFEKKSGEKKNTKNDSDPGNFKI